MKIRLASNIQTDSIVDGEGVRAVIWMQGCSHNCEGCHNPNTHDFEGGFISDTEDLKKEIDKLKLEKGITLSGGDPFFQIEASLDIAKYCQETGKNVWCYTGYTFEHLLIMSKKNTKIIDLLSQIDVLIDGKFVIEKKNSNVKFRGSTNQRIIDVGNSLIKNKAIQIKKYDAVKKNSSRKEKVFI